jgi:hypothetical protein
MNDVALAVATGWLDTVKNLVPTGVRPFLLPAAIALLALLVLLRIWRGLKRALRRRRPPTIHPRLARYNVDQAELDRERRDLARQIVATSTSTRLAGYRMVRQVEAVFVEGLRTPDDAIIALKAAAAQRGANAILNVKTDRTAAGKCSASGDAIVIAPLRPGPAPGQEKRTPSSDR